MSSQITDVTPSPLISHPPGRRRRRPLPDTTTVNAGAAMPFDICDQSAVETLGGQPPCGTSKNPGSPASTTELNR
jgi:hypothetical protein